MATPTLAQARSHYDSQQRLAQLAIAAIRQLWKLLSGSPDAARTTRELANVVSSFQYASAVTTTERVAAWAGDQDTLTQARAFAGYDSEGQRIEDALAPLVEELLEQAEKQAQQQLYRLDRMVQSMVADAGRSAGQVEFVARPDWQNYVRMLTPPSCDRCAILAGRVYRDLEAFQRHPGCDCVMVPVQDWESAHDAGLVSSFEAAFERGEVRGLSKADAQAIRDGADPSQVVNAVRGRGLYTTGLGQQLKITSSGTTRRGLANSRMKAKGYQQRLRPESIYAIAGDDRERALDLLYDYGYLVDKPPAPNGGDQEPPATIDDQSGPTGPERTSLADLFTDTRNPGLDHERFAEGTWRAEMDRAFGDAGLRAQFSFVAFYPDRFNIAGEIVAPDGRTVGGFDRQYDREADGTMVAHHEFLKIADEQLQGTGFARDFNEALYDWYRFSGFERVELDANIDVGGYAWARDGYNFADEIGAVQTLGRLAAETIGPDEDAASVADILDRATRYAFGDPQYPTAMQMSQAGRMPHHRGRGASWPGKRAMIGYYKTWRAVRWL